MRKSILILIALLTTFTVQGQTNPDPSIIRSQLTNMGLDVTQGSLEYLDNNSIDLSPYDNTDRWDFLSDEPYSNFIIGARVILDTESVDDECGFMFRHRDDVNYYTITINRDRDMTLFEKFRHAPIWTEGDGRFVDDRRGATNELILVAVGSSFYVFINGQFADSFTDTSLQTGRLAAIGGTYEESSTTLCSFENVWLWDYGDFSPHLNVPVIDYQAAIDEVAHTISRQRGFTQVGFLSEYYDYQKIDLSNEDNIQRWIYFNERYSSFAAGTTIRWGPGSPEDTCGLVFREADFDNFYMLEIDRNGYLIFSEQTLGEWQENIYANYETISVEPEVRNELIVVGQNDTFDVYINRQYITSYVDDSHQEGQVSLTAGTYDESDETFCTFYDSWVWEFNRLPSPVLMSPLDGAIFNRFPRLTTLQWQPVEGAVSYMIEIELASPDGDIWSWVPEPDDNLTETNLTELSFEFIGAQPGRWRVWAIDSTGRPGHKSTWWTFAYDL